MLLKNINVDTIGVQMYELAQTLYPICRSITGDGVRETFKILQQHIPLSIFEVPSGTKVFDWTVPKEWNIREAWIKNPKGERIIDLKNHNLHVLNYSTPIHKKMSLEALKKHLFTLPDQPDLIPYRTAYYQENWGFCMAHSLYEQLKEGTYEICIDSTLKAGHLTYGELFISGESEQEILLSTHICHPSLANDNLSGISLLTHLAKALLQQKNKYSYRFIFIPGTIGAITWLAQNQEKAKTIQYGLVTSLVGDDGEFTYKKSRTGNTEIDQVVPYVLEQLNYPYQVIDFIPYGYDERQFCSPAFNLMVGNLGRTPYGQFPEYHTSADNLDFINPKNLMESFIVFKTVVEQLEQNKFYINQNPHCEPQLGKRGLYDAIGGDSDSKKMQLAMLWVLNMSDGTNSLASIAYRSGYDIETIEKISKILLEKELLIKKD